MDSQAQMALNGITKLLQTMEANQMLKADWLDLLFDGRNKEYGAYDLRRRYASHLHKALAAMLGSVLLVVAGASLFKEAKQAATIIFDGIDTVKLTPVELLKNDPPPAQAQAQPPRPATVAPPNVVPTLIASDHLVKDPLPEPAPSAPDDGILRNYGKPGDGGEGPATGMGQTSAPAPVPAPVDDNVVFTSVQRQAQFPGGSAAWRRYLESRLNANLPVDNGAPAGVYTVVVSFVVDREGRISDVKVEQPQPFGMSEEAMRVIARGPQWDPAEQNGRKVIYRQRQSITFQVAGEE